MKKLLSIVLTLSMVLCLFGCGAGGNKPVYGIILSADEPFQQAVAKGFQAVVTELGAECTVRIETDAESQRQAITELKEQGAAGIALWPAAGAGLDAELNSADFAGVPVVTVGSDTDRSHAYINHAPVEDLARAMLDLVLEELGPEGTFAVVADNRFSGHNACVSAMEYLIQEEKYQSLTWVRTLYVDPDSETIGADALGLLDAQPQIQMLCCTHASILEASSKALETAGSPVRTTGFSTPSQMSGLVGEDKVCPEMFLWDPEQIGSNALLALRAMAEGLVGEPGTEFTAADGKTYAILEGLNGKKTLEMSALTRADETNINDWAKVY